MNTAILPLQRINNHIFFEIDQKLWLVDTGAPMIIGNGETITLLGKQYRAESSDFISPESITNDVKVPCAGLLGGGLLNQYDWIFDLEAGEATLSTDSLTVKGTQVPLGSFLGTPTFRAEFNGNSYPMIFDTGAHISYMRKEFIDTLPVLGDVTDFHPLVGTYTVETHRAEISIEGLPFTLTAGVLPDELLSMHLILMPEHQEVIDNSILVGRKVGYFPRRKLMIL